MTAKDTPTPRQPVKRFDVGKGYRTMNATPHGHYVAHDDYATLERELAEARAANVDVMRFLDAIVLNGFEAKGICAYCQSPSIKEKCFHGDNCLWSDADRLRSRAFLARPSPKEAKMQHPEPVRGALARAKMRAITRDYSEDKAALLVLAAYIEAMEQPVGELRKLLGKAIEFDGGVEHDGDDDEIGRRSCCRVISYKPHETGCWVVSATALLVSLKAKEQGL